MPNYAVHIFPHVRVKIIGITADTPAEALAKTERVNLDLLKQYNINSGLGNGMVAVDVEHDESAIDFAMVDTILPTGEVDYDEAAWLNGDGTPMIDGLTHAEVKAKNSDLALKFYDELLASTETFTAIADKHGAITLADVIYLQAAILKGTHIEVEEGGESRITDLVMQLPSATTWVGYIKDVNQLKPYRVMLHEEPGDKFKLMFECYAEDDDHAEEQAENAYPGCEIVNCVQFDFDGTQYDKNAPYSEIAKLAIKNGYDGNDPSLLIDALHAFGIETSVMDEESHKTNAVVLELESCATKLLAEAGLGVTNKQSIDWRFNPDPAPSAQSLLSCDNLNKGLSFGSPELNLSNPSSTRWTATVIRTGYGSRVIEVESDKPISEREARSIAIEKAGNYVFSEHGSDYEIEDIH